MRSFATGVPLVFYLLYVLTLMLTDRIWWSVHTITGAVAAVAAASASVSFPQHHLSQPGDLGGTSGLGALAHGLVGGATDRG